jgi:hypothetical protein
MKTALLRAFVFAGVFVALVPPSGRVVERLWARDVSAAPPPYFPILLRSQQGKFVIERFQNLSPQSRLVTDIANPDVDTINGDLRFSISAENSKYSYVRILGRGEGYTDATLLILPLIRTLANPEFTDLTPIQIKTLPAPAYNLKKNNSAPVDLSDLHPTS